MQRLLRRFGAAFVLSAALSAAALAGPACAATVPALPADVTLSASSGLLDLGFAEEGAASSTYISQRQPFTPFFHSTRLLAGRDGGGFSDWSLLRFDIDAATPTPYVPYVHQAVMRLYAVSSTPGTQVVGAAKAPWCEGAVWSANPGVVWRSALRVSGANRWVDFDVTGIVSDQIAAGPASGEGIVLGGSTRGSIVTYASTREPYRPHRPRIDVNWSVPHATVSAGVRRVAANGSDVVTATVSLDMGGPWARTDVREVRLRPNGNGEAGILGACGDFGWFRDRPGAGWDASPAPGGGWFAASTDRYSGCGLVTPVFSRWTTTVSPDARRRTVRFAWTLKPCALASTRVLFIDADLLLGGRPGVERPWPVDVRGVARPAFTVVSGGGTP